MHAVMHVFLMKTSRFGGKVMHELLWLMHVGMQMGGFILFPQKGQEKMNILVPMEIGFWCIEYLLDYGLMMNTGF